MVRWWLILSLLATGVAHANEIAGDGGEMLVIEPPPVVKRKPPMQSLGFRFGMANSQIDDHDRTLITFGMQWAFEIIERRMRTVVDYEWLMVMGKDAAMKSTRGRGHGVRAGARVTLAHMLVRDIARLYVDAEGAVGAAYLTDSELGPRLLPNVSVGARFGYELFSREPTSQSTMFDGHIMVRALVTRGDVGFVFGVGMEWGR